MCLTRQAPIPIPEVGYKVFRHKASLFTTKPGTFLSSTFGKPICVDEWVEDTKDCELLDDAGKPYRTGFHVFVNKVDAEIWGQPGDYVLEVEINKESVTAAGYQIIGRDPNEAPVVVCRWIRVRGSSARPCPRY